MRKTDFEKWVDHPLTRLRVQFGTDSGDVKKFTVQLEYDISSTRIGQAWRPVARFDHNPFSKKGHDIRDEGLHMDVLNADYSKHDVLRGFPPVQVNDAPAYCETYLQRNHDTLVAAFEKRNKINGRFYTP